MKNQEDIKVFIVDDNPFCLDLYQTYLYNQGYKHVSTFSNSEDCLAKLSHQPDIVFVDHDMQPINGLELMKKIKAELPAVVVVFVSAQRHIKKAIHIIQQGADDYIVKDGNETNQILHSINQYFVNNL